MSLSTSSRALIALLFGLVTLAFAPEAWAHGSHHHRTPRIESHGAARDTSQYRLLQMDSMVQSHVGLADARKRTTESQGHCGASMCCGSVCGTSCSLTEEVVIPRPAASAKRLKFAQGPPQSGLGVERISRPPKT
jgi:hypothetical protein